MFTSFFSGLIVNLSGNKIGLLKVYYLYFFFFFIALIYFVGTLYNIISTQPNIEFDLITVVTYETYTLKIAFKIDKLTMIMLFVVISISFSVCIFSMWYMKGDPNHMKFLNYLNYFMFFMILLVTGDTLLVVFIGWEGIGIFSYLLINFWNDRLNANRSAFKAIFVNKLGDSFIFLLISIYVNLFENKYVDSPENFLFYFVSGENVILNVNLLFLVCSSLFIAAVAKSAQFILHVWLPDAMEGPTPVSALLHAATMVTAGAYVLIKFNWINSLNDNIIYAILLTGILTNFISSFIAMFQSDIKKIIAYSTASQMGLIFITIGMYKPILSFFHLFNHAFFKALLFILAGVIIHHLNNKQDLRFFNNIKKEKFFLYTGFFVSISTLAGVPFLSAFYSKDLIIQFAFFNINCIPAYVNFFLLISVISTLVYSFRIMMSIYYFDNNEKYNFFFKKFFLKNFNNESVIVIYLLVLFSIHIGLFFSNIFTYEDITFSTYISKYFNKEKLKDFLHFEYLSMVLITSIQFITVIAVIYEVKKTLKVIFSNSSLTLQDFLAKKFYFDIIYYYISKFLLSLRNIVKEEKNLNENFISFHFKNYVKKTIIILKLIYASKFLSVIFLFYIIVDVILFTLFTKIFIISVCLTFLQYVILKIIKKLKKNK